MKLRSDVQVLEAARLAINNTEKNTSIQKQMAAFGFTPKRIQEGKVLLENAKLLQQVKESHYNDRWAIAQQLNTDLQATRILFKEHVDMVRIVFRNDLELLYNLKIHRISTKTWEWPQQALDFYTLIEEHASRLEPVGINSEGIAQAKASVQALIDLKENRIMKKGLAEDSTQKKRKAFKALKDWIMEFRGTARLAYKDNPQLLEIFGISVSSKV